MPDKKPRQLSPLEVKINNFFDTYFHRIPFIQKILFVYHLQTMTKAGLSIVNALKVLSEEIENKKLRLIIGKIKTEVETGRQLSEVLAEYPKVFPEIYVSMIAAGEAAGTLEDALAQVNNQMHKSHELTSKIRGAMIYPAVVFTAMMGIALEMVIFVLPKIMVMFKDFKAELPLATRILVGITDFMGQYGVLVSIGLFFFIILVVWLIKKPNIKRIVHRINLHLPIAGPIIKKINLARFTLTLSSLLESAIPIIEAVKIAASVQTNVIYRERLLIVAETLKKGSPLSEILKQSEDLFPPMVIEMIMVGEQSGEVEKMLKELAEYYTNEVDFVMKNFSTIIEPVIIVILGLMVAGIAVAVIMPMYSLAQAF